MKTTERQRVQAQCSRARGRGTASTLSEHDWAQTVADFNGLCAYCLREPYGVIEHFLPVSLAGTTVNNCIPACLSCNRKKRNLTGNMLITKFGEETIERIQMYLNQRQVIEEAPIPRLRQKPLPSSPVQNALYLTLSQATRELHITRDALHYRLKKWGITVYTFPHNGRKYISIDDIDHLRA